MITKIAFRLEEELKREYGTNADKVSLSKSGDAICVTIVNKFGCANYSIFEESMIEQIVQGILESIQSDFVYARSTDEED